MIDAQTNPLLPADFIVPSPLRITNYFYWDDAFTPVGRSTSRPQRLRVRILSSVPFKHQFATQQYAAFGSCGRDQQVR
jgi:hypothetical protein